ncbi:phosphatase PAP2 family protein [Streptomyces apocyni]|uniref:phosphatase PAP2 family protein n=1 Tax=Streptomyces apocyni TaxID=2654677 RepID=UPI0012EA282A|nr:phosphatase PAP2 family protein [Streptomyces apocyni]
MAVLETSGSNPDVGLLRDINGLAESTPRWLDLTLGFVGEYGLLAAMVLLVLWCWITVRRVADPEGAVAAVLWAPLAALGALLVNIPIRGFVGRPRPFVEQDGIAVLGDEPSGYSFVSDHATLAMALGVGLFVAHRKFGLVAIGLAMVEGLLRVFLGVHYPTDVIGGFALGTAVTLLLAPLAMALLTPLTRAVSRSRRLGWLVRARPVAGAVELPEPRAAATAGSAGSAGSGGKDLAA